MASQPFASATPVLRFVQTDGMSELFAHSAAAEARSLLSWWVVHGRREPSLKPWMFTSELLWPQPEQELDPYGIWMAEVMRCSAA